MNLFVLSMALTVAANVLYHLCQKAIPGEANPIASLIVSYAGALVFSLICYPLFYPASGFVASFRTLNWASAILSFGLIGLEMGFLLAYRAGWNLSLGALYSNVAVSLLLIPIGLIFFREPMSAKTGLGIIFALIGLALISLK